MVQVEGRGGSMAHPWLAAKVRIALPATKRGTRCGKCLSCACMERNFAALSRRKSKDPVIRKTQSELCYWKGPGNPCPTSAPTEDGSQRAGQNPSSHTGTVYPLHELLRAGWSPRGLISCWGIGEGCVLPCWPQLQTRSRLSWGFPAGP